MALAAGLALTTGAFVGAFDLLSGLAHIRPYVPDSAASHPHPAGGPKARP